MGLLQREVAQELGVDIQSIRNWEQHRSNPKLYLLPPLAAFLGYLPWEAACTFPEVLRTYRRAAGLSQDRLAMLAGIDESTVAKWERGDSRPLRRTLHRVERFFRRLGMPLPAFGQDVLWTRRSVGARKVSTADRQWRKLM